MSRITSDEQFKYRLPEKERKAAIENIRKGFLAANTTRDNPELLLNAILIKEGLIDPEVANLSDNISIGELLDHLTDTIPYYIVKKWDISIVMSRDLEHERKYYQGDWEKKDINTRFVISGKVNDGHEIYASEPSALLAVRSIQRSISSLYVRNNL